MRLLKNFLILAVALFATAASAQVMGRLPGVLFPADRGGRTSTNLSTQITAVSTRPYTFILDKGTWDIADDISFPTTIKLVLLPGAKFDIAAGKNLEILGEFEAPLEAVFTGSGTASGPASISYRPAIWGDTNQYNIGTAYLTDQATFTNLESIVSTATNDIAVLGEEITGWGAAITNIDIYLDATTNDIALLQATSDDFLSVSNYLLNATNGVVPILQDNQDITAVNFSNVNVNTEATTNLFNIVAQLLGQESNTNYTGWVDAYLQMNTNYAALPTGLPLSFPNLFTNFTTNVVNPAVQDAVDFHAFTAWTTNVVLSEPATGTFYPIGAAAGSYPYDRTETSGTSFSTNTAVFTAPYDGWYWVGMQLRATSGTATALWVGIVLNGDTTVGETWGNMWAKPPSGTATTDHLLNAGFLIYMDAADEVQLYLYRPPSGGTATYTALRYYGYMVQKL